MLVKSFKTIAALAISSALGLAATQAQDQPQAQQTQQTQQAQPQAQQAKPQKNWKDRAEYDLYAAATKETNPEARLKILDDWKAKYPNSDFNTERLVMYLGAYQQLNRPADVINTAKQILDTDAKNLAALNAIAYIGPTLTSPTPDDLGTIDKAANALISNSNDLFSAANKPQNVSDADWQKAKTEAEASAYRAQGWVAMQRKDNPAAEKAFTESLKLSPDHADVSYWLGMVILAQKNPDTQAQALYHFARAAAYDGPGALPPAGRQQLHQYLQKVYTSYHGSQQGLPELMSQAKNQPFPPAGFKVLSAAEVAAGKEEQLAKENPSLAFWLKLKAALQDQGGDQYFESGMKGALVPPEGTPALRGKIVSVEGAKGAKSAKVAIADPNTADATLVFDPPMPNKAEPGTEVEFRGIPESFAKEPFNVTFKVEKSQITGWPAPAAPAKRAPGARKPAARKRR